MDTLVSPVSPAGSTGNRFVHMNSHIPFTGDVIVASWNVEGLSDIKLFELTGVMRRRGISILCIQEVRILKSPHFVSEDGF